VDLREHVRKFAGPGAVIFVEENSAILQRGNWRRSVQWPGSWPAIGPRPVEVPEWRGPRHVAPVLTCGGRVERVTGIEPA